MRINQDDGTAMYDYSREHRVTVDVRLTMTFYVNNPNDLEEIEDTIDQYIDYDGGYDYDIVEVEEC